MQDESRLFALKKAYCEIEIPRELDQKMKQAIEKAQKKGQNHWRKTLGICGTMVAAVFAAVVLLANASPATAKAMESIPVLGPLAELVAFRTFEEESYGVEAHLEIPQIEGLENEKAQAKLNAAVNEYAEELMAMYREAEENAQRMKEEAPELMEKSQTAHVSLESRFAVLTDNDRIFSMAMYTDLVMAGAQQSSRHFTVDKASGAILTLEKLFQADSDYITVLSEEVIRQMKEQMAEDETVSYFIGENEFDGFMQIKADQDFYINEAGNVVLCFDEYDVAPGYMGAVEFEIPKETVKEIAGAILLR